MSSPVDKLDNDEQLRRKLNASEKLVVLEFVKTGSEVCNYVKSERDKIAKEMEDQAEFYELDVEKFKKYAERFQVEALPAFVVMQNFVKKRHVVGTDDLKKAIQDAYDKFTKSNMQVDSNRDNESHKKQPEASSGSNIDSAGNNGPQPKQTPPNSDANSCSIL